MTVTCKQVRVHSRHGIISYFSLCNPQNHTKILIGIVGATDISLIRIESLSDSELDSVSASVNIGSIEQNLTLI